MMKSCRSLPLRFYSLVLYGLLVVCGVVAGSQPRGKDVSLRIGKNYRIHPSNFTQTETFIVRHPSNANILFACAHTISPTGFVSEGIYATTDGGNKWFGSDTCSGAPITFHGGEPAITIDKDGTFLLVRYGFSPGLYAHFSSDNGVTWSSQKALATDDEDRAMLATDADPLSSHYGKSYAAWVHFSPPYPVFLSSTTDGGQNWSAAPMQINNPSQRCRGARTAMGPNGTINVCWAAVVNTSPFTEDQVGFASSTDGGSNWTLQENAFDMNGVSGTFPAKSNIRANGLPRIDVDKSGGTRNGWMYIVTTERDLAPAGSDPDIILHRSTDGGQTWSVGIRVNQDSINNGKFQFFPAIHIDDGGGVNILYYDDRKTTSDSAGVFLSRSTDGGNSWADYEISDHHFKPQPIGGLGGGYQGDNIGLTSLGSTLWPVWMDNSTGVYQIWTGPIELFTLAADDEPSVIPGTIELRQNYPNPFNPSTTISFVIGAPSSVSLKVYNVLGEEVTALVNESKRAGTYSVTWNASEFPSGVYVCRLTAAGQEKSLKLLIIR